LNNFIGTTLNQVKMNIFKRLLMPGRVETIAEPKEPRSVAELHPTVNLDSVEFLMTEDVIFQNVTVEELHQLIAATEQNLRKTLVRNPFDFDLRVRFTVYTDKPLGIDLGLQVPIDGTNLPETLQHTADELNRMEEVNIYAREHPVTLCAYYQIKKTD
jgi:hypothetical protein